MTAPRTLTLDDLWTFKDVGAIALSPAGKHLLFLSNCEEDRNEEQRQWLF